MKKAFLLIPLFLSPKLSFATSPIDFAKLNTVVAAILNEAVKVEQFKDAQGREMLDYASLAVRPSETDLDKGNFAADFKVGLNGSLWASGEKSSLKASVKALTKMQGSDPLMELEASLTLDTQVVALVRYGSAKIIADSDPCTDAKIQASAEKHEVAFLQAACNEFRLFPKVADFATFVAGLEKIAVARNTYLESRIAELVGANDAWQLQSLTEEKKYLAAALTGFKSRTAISLQLATQEKMTVAGDTEVTSVFFHLSPASASIGIKATSPEIPRLVEGYKEGIESVVEILNRADTDPEKRETVRNIQSALHDLVQLSKEWITE